MTTPGNYLECVQGTELWAKLRCGYVTASRAGDVIATTKKGNFNQPEKAHEALCLALTEINFPTKFAAEKENSNGNPATA
jgi:hypothetical protein